MTAFTKAETCSKQSKLIKSSVMTDALRFLSAGHFNFFFTVFKHSTSETAQKKGRSYR
jgi:hypothetical protein